MAEACFSPKALEPAPARRGSIKFPHGRRHSPHLTTRHGVVRESFRMPCIRKDSRLLCSDFVSWLQQSDKTGLFEVMVGSEGVADAVLGHEEKTDGIAQGPVLVEPLL